MDFLDRTLLSLAGTNTRVGVFDQLALEHLVAAGYDAAGMGITGPYQARFDEFRMGVSLPAAPRLEGVWQQPGRSELTELRVTLTGLGAPPIQIDALWRGAIIARAGVAESPVTAIQGEWADLDLESLDADIAAALGGLPSNPQLEQERRTRLLARLRQGVVHPQAITEATLSEWLSAEGADSVGALLERSRGQLAAAGLTVTFAAPPAAPPLPRPLPVTVALLIRDSGSLAQLLDLSHQVRERLGALGAERPRTTAGARPGALIGWVVPANLLDDEDWPGANPNARRTEASQWLGREGIALIPVP